jgi:hypothetical protein
LFTEKAISCCHRQIRRLAGVIDRPNTITPFSPPRRLLPFTLYRGCYFKAFLK